MMPNRGITTQRPVRRTVVVRMQVRAPAAREIAVTNRVKALRPRTACTKPLNIPIMSSILKTRIRIHLISNRIILPDFIPFGNRLK